mgnify:CR=1 FL=1
MNNTTKTVLKIDNLSICFDINGKKCHAIRDLNLTVNAGELVALVGESGCGKTLCASFSMGLGPQTASLEAGSILVNGQDMTQADDAAWNTIRGKDVSMIFQEPMTSLNPLMKVGRQIAENALNRGVPKAEAKNKALEMIRLAGLPDANRIYNCYPHQLSGGQRQRIMICLALINQPKLLIADEPTTALDVTIQAQILELMQDLQKKLGMAIIIVTHDLGVIADMCDEIIVMYGGRVCERGTAEDIFYRPHHEYTKGLLRSIPNVDKIGEKLIPIPGTPINLLNMPKGCAFCPRCENAMKICIEEVPQEMQMPDGHYASCWLNVKEAMEAKQGGGKHE